MAGFADADADADVDVDGRRAASGAQAVSLWRAR
ncbi:hypothetical protein JOE61_003687 [Nocardioides salarius]|uniref:Uncharacterized protein n=1 Tax=Nocardioides salarius TaxID=374513 RepID=A0ABS2MFA5_9ACTN|nr:hypothetical protein [Nocardioides salarius]